MKCPTCGEPVRFVESTVVAFVPAGSGPVRVEDSPAPLVARPCGHEFA